MSLQASARQATALLTPKLIHSTGFSSFSTSLSSIVTAASSMMPISPTLKEQTSPTPTSALPTSACIASPTPNLTSTPGSVVFSSSSSSSTATATSSLLPASSPPKEQSLPTNAVAVVETPKVQSLTTQTPTTHIVSIKTSLSFCLPTSLAFFKDLTWEQTPWIHSYTASRTAASPIIPADADAISRFLVNLDVSQEAVENALFFGSSISGIDLFVTFPNSEDDTNPATDENFLKTWHDQIVKPAFDRAWKDGGLTPIYGAEVGAVTSFLRPTGARTAMEALPAKGFIKRLHRNTPGSVSANWPNGNPDVLNEAWQAIKGMLKDHPNLKEFQDPILLAVYRAEIHLGENMTSSEQYNSVAKEWDGHCHWEYCVPQSLGLVLESVVRLKEDRRSSETPLSLEGELQVKRKTYEGFGLWDHEEEEGGHRTKRRKRAEDVAKDSVVG